MSASRIICGEIPLHQELESELADFLGVDEAMAQVAGHSTNVNVIGHLFGEGDLILHDSLSHNSIVQGAMAAGALRKQFRHNNPEILERDLSRLRSRFTNVLVVIEGVYSMDGDIAALEAIVDIKERYDAYLMIDEAHSLGTIGDSGRGVTSHFGIDPGRVDILMGTLSKSLNSCGGYIAGRSELIQYLRYRLPGFLFSVGISPANTAAALESLRICREHPEWTAQLRHKSDHSIERATELGWDTGLSGGTPIVPLITGDSARTVELSRGLFDRGINVAPITYPAVPEREARLRFFLSRLHTDEQLDATFRALDELSASAAEHRYAVGGR